MPRAKKEDAGFGPRFTALRNGLAGALQVSADELLGLKPPPKARLGVADNDPETRRLRKRCQAVVQLPEQDQRAVIRLINSLAAHTPGKGARNVRAHG